MIGSVQDMLVGAVVQSSMNTTGPAISPVSISSDAAGAYAAADQQPRSTTEAVQQAAGTSQADTKDQDKFGNEKPEARLEDKMDENSVDYMTKELNDLMARIDCNLKFKYHKEVDTMSVQMIDKRDNKVLKEIPSEEMIEHMIKAKDWLGAFLDKNA